MWLSFTGLMLENLSNEEAMIITKSEIVLNSIALKGLSPPAHSNHCQCLDEVILSDKPAGAWENRHSTAIQNAKKLRYWKFRLTRSKITERLFVWNIPSCPHPQIDISEFVLSKVGALWFNAESQFVPCCALLWPGSSRPRLRAWHWRMRDPYLVLSVVSWAPHLPIVPLTVIALFTVIACLTVDVNQKICFNNYFWFIHQKFNRTIIQAAGHIKSTTEKATDATGIFKATDSGKRVSMEPLPANADFPHTADLRFARSIL